MILKQPVYKIFAIDLLTDNLIEVMCICFGVDNLVRFGHYCYLLSNSICSIYELLVFHWIIYDSMIYAVVQMEHVPQEFSKIITKT